MNPNQEEFLRLLPVGPGALTPDPHEHLVLRGDLSCSPRSALVLNEFGAQRAALEAAVKLITSGLLHIDSTESQKKLER